MVIPPGDFRASAVKSGDIESAGEGADRPEEEKRLVEAGRRQRGTQRSQTGQIGASPSAPTSYSNSPTGLPDSDRKAVLLRRLLPLTAPPRFADDEDHTNTPRSYTSPADSPGAAEKLACCS